MRDFLDDELCEFSLQEVEGERVVLRPLGDADVQPLFELIEGSREFLSELGTCRRRWLMAPAGAFSRRARVRVTA